MVESRAPERQLLYELLERESRNVARMLRAFPPGRMEQRVPGCPCSAREMAWSFVVRERLLHYLLAGRMMGAEAEAPRSFPEVVGAYEESRRHTRALLAALTSQRWAEVLRAPVGPGRWEQASRGELLWKSWKEIAHHASHFALHLRRAREDEGTPPGSPGPVAEPLAFAV